MRLRCFVLAALLVSTPLSAADFVLVDKAKGIAPAPIVVAKDASPRTREAAQMLASYIEKTCGAKPAVIDGEPPPRPERAVWIGVQPAVKSLFPKIDFDFKHPEEILIAANENHLVIAGRDRWDPARPDATTREGVIKGKQQEYGTVNAVLTFLQNQLGVRWFWPGELGEDVQPRDRIAIAPFEHRYHPQIRSRGGIFHFSSLGNKGYGKSHDWTFKQRLQLDSMEMAGGHGFGDWWDKYSKTHPDIFALQPDGTRSGFPNPHNAKLCMSNPKVWELWLEGVAEQIKQNPTLMIFNASPNDGWASGHCTCEKCRAWDHKDGEPRVFNWFKKNETHPALSDRDVTFANTLGALLKKTYPDKDYRVLMMSYGHSRPAPVAARPADNVVMSIVANFFGRTGLVDRGSTRGDTYRKQFEAWAKIVPAMLWRPNTGSPAGWQQGLPDVSIQQTIRDFKDVAAANCQGIFIDGIWEHWATHGPQYYVIAQLAWNPKVDAQAVLADYYERAFGPAAVPVREYFEAIEKDRMAFTAKDGESGVFGFTKLYTPELLNESQKRLDRAAAAVKPDSIFAKRVAFVQAGLTYTKMMMEIIPIMEKYWKKKDEAIAAQVRTMWMGVEKHATAQPFAINWSAVRPITPRMAGLHPDYLPKKQKGVRAVELDK